MSSIRTLTSVPQSTLPLKDSSSFSIGLMIARGTLWVGLLVVLSTPD